MLDIALAGTAYRASESEFKRIMGIPSEGRGVPQSLIDFGRQPADESWVFKCVHYKAMQAAKVPLRVEVKDGSGWQPLEGTSDGAGEDLQNLLDDVNEAWEGPMLRAYTSAGGSVHGGCYWLMVKGRLGGRPKELHWLSGAYVAPEMGRTFPKGYWYSPVGTPSFGDRKFYPADEVIPLRATVNLEDPYTLLSPLSAARYEISTGKQAAKWNDALLRNWGIPAGAWVADPAADIGPSDKGFIKRALRALRGPDNQGKTPILPGGLKWQQLSLSEKDADWIESRKVSRMTVCAVLGVPLVLAGDDEKASVYASMRDAERVFWRATMIPEGDYQVMPMNSHLVPLFDPGRKKLRIAYDYTNIEALRGAPTEEMAQWLAFVKEGLPINRAIAQFGMGSPLDGGDEAFKHQKDAERKAEQDKEKAMLQAEAMAKQPRPEEYDTPKKTGGESKLPPGGDRIRAIGKGLYKHPAIRAFLDEEDTSGLEDLVNDDEMPTLITGLRRRYSTKQIIEGDPTRDFVGLADLVPEEPAPVQDQQLGDIRSVLDDLVARMSRPRKVRRIARRNADGRIVAVDEIEIE